MPEQDQFVKFVKSLHFDVSEYLIPSLSDYQEKLIEEATSIFKDNIVGDIAKQGGNIEKNKQKFENFVKKAEEELDSDKYKDSAKELKQFFKDYVKKLRELIAKTCVAIIPVKEMPWADVLFRSVPRISIENKKVNLLDNAFAYYGEIKCVIPKTTIYGKMKSAKPLFAPFMGELDLGSYKLDEPRKSPLSQIFSYVSAIINALDSDTTRSQLTKYHEGYQRHGDPICDFLMNKSDLLDAMEKIKSGLESNRIKSDIAVCGIAIPLLADKTMLLVVVDESQRTDSGKYGRCFEGFLRFSAACCEAPSIHEKEAQLAPQQAGTIRTPGGQELKTWTAEELAQEAQKRGTGPPPGMEVWDEESLAKAAKERHNGVPEGMDVWTEEELQELARKRQGGLDIPEWEPDPELIECSNCGYNLRKGWSECPICQTPVGAKSSPASPPEDKPNDAEGKRDEKIEEEEHKESSEPLENNESSDQRDSSNNNESKDNDPVLL